jgi:phenylalanyl-tRNA synthetase alpha chain
MSETTTDLQQLAAAARERVAGSASLADLDALKVEFFGKKGAITAQLKSLGALAPDARREAGARINAVRDEIGQLMTARQLELEAPARKLAGCIDVTQPTRAAACGCTADAPAVASRPVPQAGSRSRTAQSRTTA